jgi:hypothetical protein
VLSEEAYDRREDPKEFPLALVLRYLGAVVCFGWEVFAGCLVLVNMF